MPLIYSTHALHPRVEQTVRQAGDLVVASALDAETLTREAAEADVLIVRAPIPPALFGAQKRLRLAVRHGAGLDWIPIPEATAAGILVANVPGVNASTVAEHVIFGAMAVLRRFRAMDRDMRSNGWLAGRRHADLNRELRGKTLGIIGMGNIGRQVARIAREGFGLTVVANTRDPRSLAADIPYRTVDELVMESDVIVICCPLTSETKCMINAARIARMRHGAVLVNVARGAIIDDEALVAALRRGRIGGAALDVFVDQPLPPDHPYYAFDNVVVTPHMAGITEESMERMGAGAAAETLRVLRGELPVELRNPEVVPVYRARFPG